LTDAPLSLTALPQFPDPRDVVKLKKAGEAVPHLHTFFFGPFCAYAEPAARETSAMVPRANEPDLFNIVDDLLCLSFHECRTGPPPARLRKNELFCTIEAAGQSPK